ncbi:hypothetical protein [Haladaptatus sp. AB618]|nr:hypothetical protein [Haladaptatus sp. AB618]
MVIDCIASAVTYPTLPWFVGIGPRRACLPLDYVSLTRLFLSPA